MSDHIPFEIQAQIMKMLPVKSLVQFRSVSKQWKSLIDSSDFISNHNPPEPQPQHLFVSCFDPKQKKQKYVSFLDNNSFPKHKFSPTVPLSVAQLNNTQVIGSSKGVVCLYSYSRKPSVTGTVVLWNPTIGKSLVIDVPNAFYSRYRTVIGFVVCPRTNDVRLVKYGFNQFWSSIMSCNACQVEVFSLSTGVWRIPSINLPEKSIALRGKQEVIDGVIYWFSFDNVGRSNYFIMSFDITTENFTKINLPDGLSLGSRISLSIYKPRDSLVVLEGDPQGFHVWIMDNVVEKSFKKLFTINQINGSVNRLLGFRFSGEPIICVLDDTQQYDSDDSDYEEQEQGALFVHRSQSKDIDSIGISGNMYSFFVNSYTESLLLLDH